MSNDEDRINFVIISVKTNDIYALDIENEKVTNIFTKVKSKVEKFVSLAEKMAKEKNIHTFFNLQHHRYDSQLMDSVRLRSKLSKV